MQAAPHPVNSDLWAASLDTVRAGLDRSRTVESARAALPAWPRMLAKQFTSPVTLILILAAAIAAAVGDATDAAIVGVIVVASAALGFFQEYRASHDVQLLLGRVAATIDLTRDGETMTVALDRVLVGDVISLSAGDVIPGDCRLITASNLAVDESALTGESVPSEKNAAAVLDASTPLGGRDNCVFRGTHVVSGTGSALVVAIGANTEFGAVAARLASKTLPTSFEHGISRFGLLLVRVMIVLTIAVLVINLALGRPLVDALLFSLALAVGVTPQMLPVIVSVSLSVGARSLAKNRVIVKRLDVIEDLGSLTVLCTDKTGTLTSGAVDLRDAVDPAGVTSARVMRLAALNAGLQKGYRNSLDAAILQAQPVPVGTATAEVPYDFERKRISIAVVVDGASTLITKGAFEPLLACCTSVAGGPSRKDVLDRYRALSAKGLRVLAIASRPLADGEVVDASAERDLQLEGLLVFEDQLKEGVVADLAELTRLGVRVVMVTGDNALVAQALANRIGFTAKAAITGNDIDGMSPAALRQAVGTCDVFAEVEPRHKEEIVLALKTVRQTVGFLGDGINDSPALHAADVGISVDTATDVAREAAAIVLLDKNLGVVATGVQLGRRTFANTLKYVRFASSSNFGNVLSMVIASAVLPFLPMLPGQILLLNFLADLPNMLVARDRVDAERLVQPGHWRLPAIQRFMIVFGALSTIFDLVTFAMLLWVFHAPEAVFQSAWFIESALTQMVVLMSLRTSRFFLRSRPDGLFLGATVAIAAITFALPFMPFASFFGFAAPTPIILLTLVGIALVYLAATETVKRFSWTGFTPKQGLPRVRRSSRSRSRR